MLRHLLDCTWCQLAAIVGIVWLLSGCTGPQLLHRRPVFKSTSPAYGCVPSKPNPVVTNICI